jgi:hypothetical protein
VEPLDLSILDKRRFRFDSPPPKPEAIFRLGGHAVATPGNLVVVQSQIKSGKSTLIAAMIASAISKDSGDDFLGIGAADPKDKAIVHIDTEQCRYDADQIIRRALRRGHIDRPPACLRSYCLADIDILTRRTLLTAELERAAFERGGIFAVLIDGVGDLVIDVNNPAETNDLVAELHRLAIHYDCPIICVLHENPGRNEQGKTRGHLGSQLERKAESNLRLIKDENGVMVVFAEKCRNANIARKNGPRFKWSDTQRMHCSCETIREAKDTQLRSALKILVDEIFSCPEATDGLTWTQIHNASKRWKA